MALVIARQAGAVPIDHNGHEYELVNADSGIAGPEGSGYTLRMWETARNSAFALGAGWDLVTIDDAEENAWLVTTFGPSIDTAAFIGLCQQSGADATDADWYWASGGMATYRNWKSGEPNDDPTGTKNDYLEDGEELFSAMYSANGLWNDVGVKSKNNNMYKFGIAERVLQEVPDGGTTMGLLGLGLAGLGLLRRKI
jgi:hypothetical protein